MVPVEEQLCLNVFEGSVHGDLRAVQAFHLPVRPTPQTDDPTFRAALARACYRLEEQYRGTATPFGAGMLVVSSRKPDPFHDPAFTAGEPKRVDLQSPEMAPGLERLLQRILIREARKQGYTKFRGAYVKATAFAGATSGDGIPIELNRDCFSARVSVSQTTPYLNLDLQASMRQPLPLAIQHLRTAGIDEEHLAARLVGKEVVTVRFGLSGIIKGLEWVPAAQYRIEDLGQTLYEYWDSLGEDVDPDEEPTVLVFLQHRRSVVAYPASQLNLSLRGVPIPRQERLQIPPEKRMSLIQGHAVLRSSLGLGGSWVQFSPEPLSVVEMRARGLALGASMVADPVLAFGGGRTGSDPRDVLRWGPTDGPSDLNVVYAAAKGFNIGAVQTTLAEYYEQWRFGRLHAEGPILIEEETQKGFYRAGQAAADVAASLKGPTLIMGLLNGASHGYRAFKRGVDSQMGRSFHAVQMLRKSSALDIVAGKKWIAADLLSQAFAKATQKPAWTLAGPAGGTKGNAFLAFDVSRRREFQYDEEGDTASVVTREASAIASVCDEYGRIIQWDTYPNHTGEILGRQEAWDIFTKTFDNVRRVKGDDFRRLVVYKDGPIREAELAFIKAAAEDVCSEFAKETGVQVRIDLIGVVKTGIERVFKVAGATYANPDRGTYVVLPGHRALVCSSQPWQGTTDPIRLNYEAAIGGDWTPTEVVVREFADLAHLDWRSLYHQPKSPLVLQLVQSLGEMLTLDIETPTYIPL